MKPNDQWFEPGDKVMRVSRDFPKNLELFEAQYDAIEGKVYCVEACWFYEDAGCNAMHLVGIPREYNELEQEVPFRCSNFRKVEEIRLCVDALKHSKTQEFQTT